MEIGELEKAEERLNGAAATFELMNDGHGLTAIAATRADITGRRYGEANAMNAWTAALALARQAQEVRVQGICLLALARGERERIRPLHSREYATAALSLAREAGDRMTEAACINLLDALATARGGSDGDRSGGACRDLAEDQDTYSKRDSDDAPE